MDVESEYDETPVRDPSGGARGHELPQDSEQRRAQQRRAIAKISREELEDKYLRLHDENLVLKRHARKQEEKIKKMATKLLRLISDRKKQDQEGGGAQRPARKGRDIETEEMLEDLQSKVRELTKQNDLLKNKLMVTKQQLATQGTRPTPYPHVQSRINTGIPKPPPPDNARKGLRVQGLDRTKSATPRAFRTDVLPRYGHSLLEEAREENHRLEEMIQDLQDHISSLEQDREILQEQVRIKELEHDETLLRLKEQMSAGQRHTAKTNIHENVEMIRLQREVKEKSTKLEALKSQFANLEENLKTVKKSHDAVLSELEQLNKVYQKEQSKVLALQSEVKESSTSQRTILELQERIGSVENEKIILQEANEKLLNSAFDAERERQYRANEKQLKLQIAQLEATLKGDLNDKNTLLDKLNEERELYEKLSKENQQQQINYYQVRSQLDELQEKMKFFTRESAVDFQELEEALIIVKRRKEKGSQNLEFLEKVDEEMNNDLKAQVVSLQAEHAETVSELEKTRNMLILQHKINQDYQIEVEGATTRLEEYKQEYETKLEEYAQLLDIRAARIKKLERQLRDVAYGTKQYKVTDIADDEDYEEIDETVKLERGQNLLELHITKVVYSRDGLKALGDENPSTFVTYAFFEFELQSTPILKGDRPEFDFTSQYKVTVDDFFLQHLMKGSTTLEVHQAIGTEYRTIAACQLRFRDLLDKPHGRLHGTEQLLGLERAGVNFGTIEFWVRLRVPMDQALRLFRERVKAMGYIMSNTKAANQALATLDQPGAVGGEDARGQQRDNLNELTVKVVRCSGLKPRREGVQPSPYAVYRFFDFNDHDTTIVTNSNTPEFNDSYVYPVVMTAELDQYLKNDTLDVYIFDDTDPEDMAYIGVAKIPLISLAHDKAIRGTFELKQSDGKVYGTIDMVLKWHSTYFAPKMTSGKPKASKPPIAPTTPSKPEPVVAHRPPIKPVSAQAAPEATPSRQPQLLAASTPAMPRPRSGSQPTEADAGERRGEKSRPLPRPRTTSQPLEPMPRKSSAESTKNPVIAVTPPPQENPANPILGVTQTLEVDGQAAGPSAQESPFDSEEDAVLDDVERELEGLSKRQEQVDNSAEDVNDLVAQEMREEFGQEEEKIGKTEQFDDTMFGDTSAPGAGDDDYDEDSIAEEMDIPEPIEEEEESEEEEREEVGAGDAGQEMMEGELEDGGVSSDSEALVVMSPAMNRPVSAAASENTVSVTIFHLSLEPDTAVIDDANIQRLYVEYRFLGLSGEETETPFSLPKPKAYHNLVYNFKKVFHVDAENNKLQRDYLVSMLHPDDVTQGKIRFTLVSEPLEESQDLECEDVGYAYSTTNAVDALSAGNPVDALSIVNPIGAQSTTNAVDALSAVNPIGALSAANPIVSIDTPVSSGDTHTQPTVLPVSAESFDNSFGTESSVNSIDAETTFNPEDAESTVKPVDTESTVKPVDTESTVKQVRVDTESTVKQVDADPTLNTHDMPTESAVKQVDSQSTVKSLNADSTVNPVDAQSAVEPLNADSTVNPVDAQSAVEPLNADSTVNPVDAQSTVSQVDADSTIKPLDADFTVKAADTESTVKDVDTESTVNTFDTESTGKPFDIISNGLPVDTSMNTVSVKPTVNSIDTKSIVTSDDIESTFKPVSTKFTTNPVDAMSRPTPNAVNSGAQPSVKSVNADFTTNSESVGSIDPVVTGIARSSFGAVGVSKFNTSPMFCAKIDADNRLHLHA
ncbi:protein fantom-like [Acanthaster planci]|uniref:Protein fantom-like n=1 Tax=Acanthaster planci TaxID=133434 RepID=A0A8B7YYD2_ACAPL|nr:protein fantom-like [Acanthaster planci]